MSEEVKHKNSLKIEGNIVGEVKVIPMGTKQKVRFTLEVCDEYNGKVSKQYFAVEAFGKSVEKFLEHSEGDHVQFTGQVAQVNFTRKNGEKVNEFILKALEYGWRAYTPNKKWED